MKFILLVGGGRSGIDLLQSLFDQHSQVSQFPGIFRWGEFYQTIKYSKNLDVIVNVFLKQYEMFFDSRLNLRERHNQLGENKDKYYTIDTKEFTKNFKEFFQNKEISERNILTFIHLAYSKTNNDDISRKKFIVINIHAVDFIKELIDFDYEIIYTIRHPIASISSGIKHWLNYNSGKNISPWSVYFHIERQFNALKKLLLSNKAVHVVKLEDLHKNSKKVLTNLTSRIGMNYEENLLKSTYHGQKWWGDALSVKYLNGLNPKFENKTDINFFFKKDITIFQYFLKDIFTTYNYEFFNKEKKKLNKLKIFLPLKVEWIIFKKELKSLNIKNILLSIYYSFKRINLMKDNNFKKIDLPRSL